MKSHGNGFSVAKNQDGLLPDCRYFSDITTTHKKLQEKVVFVRLHLLIKITNDFN
jgi:hypothetical protein